MRVDRWCLLVVVRWFRFLGLCVWVVLSWLLFRAWYVFLFVARCLLDVVRWCSLVVGCLVFVGGRRLAVVRWSLCAAWCLLFGVFVVRRLLFGCWCLLLVFWFLCFFDCSL